MKRRTLLTAGVGWLIGRNAWPSSCRASVIGVEVADLQEQLEDGLKARLPNEFQFITNVVMLTKQGKLPLSLVKSTFQWAREKAGQRKYPFPYFERAMRIRAKRIGVTIP